MDSCQSFNCIDDHHTWNEQQTRFVQNQCAAPQPHSIRVNCIHDNEMRQKKRIKKMKCHWLWCVHTWDKHWFYFNPKLSQNIFKWKKFVWFSSVISIFPFKRKLLSTVRWIKSQASTNLDHFTLWNLWYSIVLNFKELCFFESRSFSYFFTRIESCQMHTRCTF